MERMKSLCKERDSLYEKQNDLKGQKQETFEAMEHVYNIDDMEHSVMTELLV